jgi:hypothetical protein
MLQQTNNEIRFFSFYTAEKVGITGLSVNIDIYGPGGAITTAASASEVGGGLYSFTLTGSSVTSTGEYAAIFKTATTSVDLQHIPSLWAVNRAGVDNLDATISSRSTATTAGIADAVWDEVLTGATHNVPASAGRRLRILDEERIIADGQVVSATTNTVTLQPIGSLCVGQTIVVTSDDTGEKQTRFILAFDSATNTASVDTQWCNIPQAGDEYLLTTVRDPLVTRNDHPAGTVGAEIDEMYLIHGLKDGEVLTVTPTSRTAGAIAQTIGGDGTNTTTVSRD